MKTLVVNYSLTGNNKLLAEHICKKLQADNDDISVRRKMKMFSMILDSMLNRTPRIAPMKNNPSDYDIVVLIAPIWAGKIASPLRSYIKEFRSTIKNFAFISISGGALGKNEKVQKELLQLAGKRSVKIKQLYISDILPENEKNDRSKTSSYKLKQSDLDIKFKSDIDDFINSLHVEAA